MKQSLSRWNDLVYSIRNQEKSKLQVTNDLLLALSFQGHSISIFWCTESPSSSYQTVNRAHSYGCVPAISMSQKCKRIH